MKTNLLRILSSFILLFAISFSLHSQSISGTVTDQNGVPLPGATVIVEGTLNGVTTDFDGNYSISASSGDTLVFSFVGYTSSFVLVESSNSISTMLEPSNVLDEVVVTGYGSQKSANISGAVTVVSGEDVARIKPVRVEDALQGQTGLNVVSSPNPGGKPSVLIRGITSFSGTDPLVVIDGINSSLYDMDAISPSDIESISVLKDASTTAMYGVRGGSGVIVITTKSGKKNQETVFTLDTSMGMQEVSKYIDVLNASQYGAILNEGSVSSGGPLIYTDLSSLGVGTDWQKELFKAAPISTTNFSASGGSDTSTYFVSAGYTSQEGVAGGGDKDFYDRSTLSANFKNDLSEKLKLIVHTKYSNIKGNGHGGGQIFNALNFDPTVPVMTNGKYSTSTNITQEVVNPMAGLSNSFSENKTDKLIGKIELQYDLFR